MEPLYLHLCMAGCQVQGHVTSNEEEAKYFLTSNQTEKNMTCLVLTANKHKQRKANIFLPSIAGGNFTTIKVSHRQVKTPASAILLNFT